MLIFYTLLFLLALKFSLSSTNIRAVLDFLIPKWEDFQNVTIWCCGLGYVCNMFGLGYGVPMELAASNNFNYRFLVRDIIIIVLIAIILSSITEIVFLLHAAEIAKSKNIRILDLGYTVEAVFLIMMDGLSDLPFSQIYLITFFSIFLGISLSTLFFQLDLVISAIQDNFWSSLNKYLKSRELLAG